MGTLPEKTRGRPRQESGLHDMTSPPPTIADPADVAALLELSDERDQWERACLARELTAYQCGYADGNRDGYERGARMLEETWPAVAEPVIRDRPSHAELEQRRYGPGGRRGHLRLAQEADR